VRRLRAAEGRSNGDGRRGTLPGEVAGRLGETADDCTCWLSESRLPGTRYRHAASPSFLSANTGACASLHPSPAHHHSAVRATRRADDTRQLRRYDDTLHVPVVRADTGTVLSLHDLYTSFGRTLVVLVYRPAILRDLFVGDHSSRVIRHFARAQALACMICVTFDSSSY